MIYTPIRFDEKNLLLLLLAAVIALFSGCASHNAAGGNLSATNRITDIVVSEDTESFVFAVKGNESMAGTAIKRDFPRGLLFLFPDTGLEIAERIYHPPDNEFIRSIEVDEIVEEKTTITRIFLVLKKDAPYALAANEAGLQVAFRKAPSRSQRAEAQKERADQEPVAKPTQSVVPTATRLRTVTITPDENRVVVHVKANGAVKDYKSFILDDPARIVFDMFNLKSPYEKEIKIAVDSKWLKQVRHFAYPDKIRLVLETHQNYLSRYSALPADDGLLIQMGEVSGRP